MDTAFAMTELLPVLPTTTAVVVDDVVVKAARE